MEKSPNAYRKKDSSQSERVHANAQTKSLNASPNALQTMGAPKGPNALRNATPRFSPCVCWTPC